MHALATHGHDIADVSNLQTALNGKAASSHTHTIANVTNLQTTLNGKAPSVLYGSTVPASLLPGQIFVKI
jgi:vacuolar-type H+-ATPase subunit C/Vma6